VRPNQLGTGCYLFGSSILGQFYDHRRPHLALGMKTPAEAYALGAGPVQKVLRHYSYVYALGRPKRVDGESGVASVKRGWPGSVRGAFAEGAAIASMATITYGLATVLPECRFKRMAMMIKRSGGPSINFPRG
jgi:hypothetical protein